MGSLRFILIISASEEKQNWDTGEMCRHDGDITDLFTDHLMSSFHFLMFSNIKKKYLMNTGQVELSKSKKIVK